MIIPEGMSLTIGVKKYKPGNEVKDSLLPKGVKEKFEKKQERRKKRLNELAEKLDSENKKEKQIIGNKK